MSYNDFRNYIYSYIKENNIEIEPVNPVWERYKLENKPDGYRLPVEKLPNYIRTEKFSLKQVFGIN